MNKEKINHFSLGRLLIALRDLRSGEELKTTLLGIGPMSENIIRATLELARDYDFPAMFIASRNQVDADRLGGGYVLNGSPKRFVEAINKVASQVGFDGILFICRDHGGPWQRDSEKEEKLSEQEAMKRARLSYLTDILSGFDVLHIDCTLDPHFEGYVPLEIVIRRTIDLVEYIERERQSRGIDPIGYEVGTEMTAGGLTNSTDFEQFLVDLIAQLDRRGLPRPDFIVGQTGTLIKMQKNIGQFDQEKAKELVSIAEKHGVSFKEHNADFLDERSLRRHPEIDIAAANTGPEFSATEAKAYLKLAELEENSIDEENSLPISNFVSVLSEAALDSERWRKWLTKEDQHLTKQEIARDKDKLREVTIISARYVINQPEVVTATERLFNNLKTLDVTSDPQREILGEIKMALQRWVDAFNLEGTTSRILSRM